MPCSTRWKYQTYLLVFLVFYISMNTAVEDTQGYAINQKYDVNANELKRGHVSRRQSIFVNNGNIVKVSPSNMAILPCSIQSMGQREVVWRRIKNDEVLTIGKLVWSKDHRILVEYSLKDNDISSWDLIIRNVRYEDAGMYECQLTSTEKITWHVELKVIVRNNRDKKETPKSDAYDPVTTKPKQRVHKQVTLHPSIAAKIYTGEERRRPADKEEYIVVGSPIHLLCNATLGNHSTTQSKLDWLKNGEIIHSNHRVLLTRYQLETELVAASEVLIDKSQLTDSGEYICRWRSKDIWVYKVYVLPNTNISGSFVEDNSVFSAVDGGGQLRNCADKTKLYSSHWFLKYFLYILAALIIKNFSSTFYSITIEHGRSSDPT